MWTRFIYVNSFLIKSKGRFFFCCYGSESRGILVLFSIALPGGLIRCHLRPSPEAGGIPTGITYPHLSLSLLLTGGRAPRSPYLPAPSPRRPACPTARGLSTTPSPPPPPPLGRIDRDRDRAAAAALRTRGVLLLPCSSAARLPDRAGPPNRASRSPKTTPSSPSSPSSSSPPKPASSSPRKFC